MYRRSHAPLYVFLFDHNMKNTIFVLPCLICLWIYARKIRPWRSDEAAAVNNPNTAKKV
jgi:hypothetical protein